MRTDHCRKTGHFSLVEKGHLALGATTIVRIMYIMLNRVLSYSFDYIKLKAMDDLCIIYHIAKYFLGVLPVCFLKKAINALSQEKSNMDAVLLMLSPLDKSLIAINKRHCCRQDW